MINPETENLLTPREAAKLQILRVNGKGPHVRCVQRWIERGRKSDQGGIVILESIRMPFGKGKVTSAEAVARFIAALNHAGMPTTAARRRQIERANQQLEAAGL